MCHLVQTKRTIYARFPAMLNSSGSCPHVLVACSKVRDYSWPIAVKGMFHVIVPRASLDIWRLIRDFAKGIPPDRTSDSDDGVRYTIDWVSQMMLQAKRCRLLNEVFEDNHHSVYLPIFRKRNFIPSCTSLGRLDLKHESRIRNWMNSPNVRTY